MANILQEYVEIRTLSLGTMAHLSQNVADWWTPRQRRGSPRTVPGSDGAKSRPVVLGPIRFLHPVWVDGRYTTAGAENGDPSAGWQTNLGLLEDACEPASASPWTFQAVHTLPSGATRTAQIQVTDMLGPTDRGATAGIITLEILIPSGVFT